MIFFLGNTLRVSVSNGTLIECPQKQYSSIGSFRFCTTESEVCTCVSPRSLGASCCHTCFPVAVSPDSPHLQSQLGLVLTQSEQYSLSHDFRKKWLIWQIFDVQLASQLSFCYCFGRREKESRKENVEWSLVHHSDVTTVELIWKPAQTSNTAPIRDPIVWRGDCSLHNPVHNGTNTVFGKRFPLHLIILDFHQAKKRQLSLNNKVIIKSSELLIDLQQIGL